MGCHLSAGGMKHDSGTGLFTQRVKTRPLSRVEAEQVQQLAAAIKAQCVRLDEAARSGSPQTAARILAGMPELVGQMDGIWGRFRGEATLYIPYWVDKDGRGAFQASAKFSYFGLGGRGFTVSGLAWQNAAPHTPALVEQHRPGALCRKICRHRGSVRD